MNCNSNLTYKLDDYDFELPEELIAQKPVENREQSKLMVLYRRSGYLEHVYFKDVLRFLKKDDLLVVNDTQVVPARLLAKKPTGGKVEILLLDPYVKSSVHECLIRSSKPLKPGMEILINGPDGNVRAKVIDVLGNGKARLEINVNGDIIDFLRSCGIIPLPPYIKRSVDEKIDSERYQTVYATKPGAVAAPTAGFHFSERLIQEIESKGIRFAKVTLHVGYGTFSPVRVEDIRHHKIHSEWCEVSKENAEVIWQKKLEGSRIVAVGTTVVRVLEWIMSKFDEIIPYSGFCDHYIYPGYKFKIVDAMITNFHLPRSSLILLVSAFAGRERILDSYKEAIRRGYRFFSYGDAMMIV